MSEWHNDPECIELTEELFAGCPDRWDGDEGQEDILVRYVHHLRDEVIRLGGCLLPWCGLTDGEPCDHGYLPAFSEYVNPPDGDSRKAAAVKIKAVLDGLPYAATVDEKSNALFEIRWIVTDELSDSTSEGGQPMSLSQPSQSGDTVPTNSGPIRPEGATS